MNIKKFSEKFTESVENNENKIRSAQNYALHVCKEGDADLKIVRDAWLDGFNTSKTADNSGGNLENRKIVAAQDFALKNCKDGSKLNLIKQAWLDGFDVCDRIKIR